MNEATKKFIDYVRVNGSTSGVEDALGDDLSQVDFEEVARALPTETTTFDTPIRQELGYIADTGYEVVSWSPGAVGEGVPATQVHLILPIGNTDMRLVLRLKSPTACDELIRILRANREFVWGKPQS